MSDRGEGSFGGSLIEVCGRIEHLKTSEESLVAESISRDGFSFELK
jgi:hypothetical protein